MKVFYSWQSDTPAKVGRTFIREALETAIAGLDLEDAERPEIDQDTKGVLGSPSIADTIFKKIRDARVIVADVTLTGKTPAGKRLCNSNVAIELGYALGVHGDEVLLKVMNTHYGMPEELPFDLAHRRWPLQYTLSPDHETEVRNRVRDKLAKDLREILQAYMGANRSPPEVFTQTPSTYNPAAYWKLGEKLGSRAISKTEAIDLQFPQERPLIYLRIWPSKRIRTLTSEILGDFSKASIEPLCGRTSGWSNERNRFGMIAFAHSADKRLLSSTQVFKSGEIWGVNEHLLREREDVSKYIPSSAYETGLRRSLALYVGAARTHFGYSNTIHVESGLVNVAEFRVAMPEHEYWGPIFEDVQVATVIDTDRPHTLTEALLKIFEAVFDAAGAVRPANYDNFPPRAS